MIVKELFAKLGLDVDTTGFTKADGLMGGLKAGLGVLAALTAAAAVGIAALVVHTAHVAQEFDKTAQMAGVTSDAIQELGYAGEKSGLASEEMGQALVHLARHMAAAKDGADEQVKAFKGISVKVVDAQGHLRDTGSVLVDVADHFASMSDSTEKTVLSTQLFGKAGAQLIPLLNKGGRGIDELRARAHELGIVLDTSAIAQAKEFNSSLVDLKAGTTALGYSIAVPLMKPANEFIQSLMRWQDANKGVVKSRINTFIGITTVLLKLALVPLKAMWTILGFIIDNWRLFALILGTLVWAALLANAEAVGMAIINYARLGAVATLAGLRAAAAWVLAALPFIELGLLLLAFVLIIDDVSTALRGGDSVLKNFLGNWQDDQPGDAWWMRDLKSLTYLLLHFGPVIDFWKSQFVSLWDWLKHGFADTWGDIVIGVKRLFGIDGGQTSQEKKAHNKMGYTKQVDSLGAGEWKTNSMGESLWYPNTTPEEAAAQAAKGGAAAGGTFSATVNQTINAAPGQSAADVAGEARRQFEEAHQQKLEEASADFGSPL